MNCVKFLFSVTLIAGVLLGTRSSAQEMPEGKGPWVVKAYYENIEQVQGLASWRSPWSVDREERFAVVEAGGPEDIDTLQKMGFQVRIDLEKTEKYFRRLRAFPESAGKIAGYPCYRTVEETYQAAQGIVASYPDLAEWVYIGDSWARTINRSNGYDLRVLKLTNSKKGGNKPKMFVMASIHAREYTPAELCTRFAEYLASNYGLDADVTWLLDYSEIHLLPVPNPDGRKMAETGMLWRKNTDNEFCTGTDHRGVDLNRNFPFEWGCCGGSSQNPCDDVYGGQFSASEPEVQAIQAYLRQIFPTKRGGGIADQAPAFTSGLFIDLHSYSSLVLWPWNFTRDPAPNGAALQTLGRKLAFFNNYRPEQDSTMYIVDGAGDDFAYGEFGIAAFTFELGTDFFQDCETFERTILPQNIQALLYAAKAARTPYRTPRGPDVIRLNASRTQSGFKISAVLDATRYNNSNGREPVGKVAGAQLFIDVPPWLPSARPVALALSSAPNLPGGKVEGRIDSAQLSPGRHTLFVRGFNISGDRGPVSAVFLGR